MSRPVAIVTGVRSAIGPVVTVRSVVPPPSAVQPVSESLPIAHLTSCLGRHRQVHRQRRLLDALLPAARDQLPVEHRVDVLAGDPLVVLGEHAVDVVLDHVGVLADVERGVGAADLGHPLAVVVLPAQLERLVAAVAGDRDVLGRAPRVRRVVVDDVPEPEDAVLAVAREVDGDRLGHVQVAVRRDVEVRHVVGDRGVLEGGRDRALAVEERRDAEQQSDHAEADRGPHEPFHEGTP